MVSRSMVLILAAALYGCNSNQSPPSNESGGSTLPETGSFDIPFVDSAISCDSPEVNELLRKYTLGSKNVFMDDIAIRHKELYLSNDTLNYFFKIRQDSELLIRLEEGSVTEQDLNEMPIGLRDFMIARINQVLTLDKIREEKLNSEKLLCKARGELSLGKFGKSRNRDMQYQVEKTVDGEIYVDSIFIE